MPYILLNKLHYDIICSKILKKLFMDSIGIAAYGITYILYLMICDWLCVSSNLSYDNSYSSSKDMPQIMQYENMPFIK